MEHLQIQGKTHQKLSARNHGVAGPLNIVLSPQNEIVSTSYFSNQQKTVYQSKKTASVDSVLDMKQVPHGSTDFRNMCNDDQDFELQEEW